MMRALPVAAVLASSLLVAGCNDAQDLAACTNAVRELANEGQIDPTAPDFQVPAECEGLSREDLQRVVDQLQGQ